MFRFALAESCLPYTRPAKKRELSRAATARELIKRAAMNVYEPAVGCFLDGQIDLTARENVQTMVN